MNVWHWRDCRNPGDMLRFLVGYGESSPKNHQSVTDRRLRLLSVRLAYRMRLARTPDSRIFFSAAERMAEGLSSGLSDRDRYRHADLIVSHLGDEDARDGLCGLADQFGWRDPRFASSYSRRQLADCCCIIREIFGEPMQPSSWRSPSPLSGIGLAIRQIADAAYDERAFGGSLLPDNLSVLSDAMEDAGCDDVSVLQHLRGFQPCGFCRGEGTLLDGSDRMPCPNCRQRPGWVPLSENHSRGCWALDLARGFF